MNRVAAIGMHWLAIFQLLFAVVFTHNDVFAILMAILFELIAINFTAQRLLEKGARA